jgi:VIT1/CCC1 family predicted Fe2+/Mn2+ transporter
MVGVVLAAFTERPIVRSALRQLAVTALAAAVTYGVGRGIGSGTG